MFLFLLIYEFFCKAIFDIAFKFFFPLLYYYMVSTALHINCFSCILLSALSKMFVCLFFNENTLIQFAELEWHVL